MRAEGHRIARAHGVVGGNFSGLEWRVGFVAGAFPLRAGIGYALSGGIALEYESGLERDLSFGRQIAEVPYQGGQGILAGVEIGRDIDGFIAPMEEVAARGSPGGVAAVDE
jgi:hypothetical protein